MRLLLLLVSLSACRFSWSEYQGTTPRASNHVMVALYAPDETAQAIARSALARDTRVTVVDVPPAALAAQEQLCGGVPCMHIYRGGCTWASQGGAHYFAIARVDAAYSSRFECTQTKGGIFDKKEECVDGRTTDEATTAAFSYDVYDSKTCEQVRSMSQRITDVALGPEEQSKPEAIAQLRQRVATMFQTIPEQITVDDTGRVHADDGLYAFYRADRYRGYARVKRGDVAMLHCCREPAAGDVLVARGSRRTVELSFPFGVVASVERAGEGNVGATLGMNLRYHPIDGGLRFGAGWNFLSYGDARIHMLAPELGWGARVTSALQLSVNLSAGPAWASNGFDEFAATASPKLHALATVRAETYFATWFYLAMDVGYVHTGTFSEWDNSMYDGGDVSASSPLVRLWFGFDL